MNKKELIEKTLDRVKIQDLVRKDAEILLNQLIEVIKESVAQGEEVTLKDFGTFTVAHHKERRGYNPVTGQEMLIAPRILPKFRPGKGWVEMVGEVHSDTQPKSSVIALTGE
jgi:DNA-binding protein HU-beta